MDALPTSDANTRRLSRQSLLVRLERRLLQAIELVRGHLRRAGGADPAGRRHRPLRPAPPANLDRRTRPGRIPLARHDRRNRGARSRRAHANDRLDRPCRSPAACRARHLRRGGGAGVPRRRDAALAGIRRRGLTPGDAGPGRFKSLADPAAALRLHADDRHFPAAPVPPVQPSHSVRHRAAGDRLRLRRALRGHLAGAIRQPQPDPVLRPDRWRVGARGRADCRGVRLVNLRLHGLQHRRADAAVRRPLLRGHVAPDPARRAAVRIPRAVDRDDRHGARHGGIPGLPDRPCAWRTIIRPGRSDVPGLRHLGIQRPPTWQPSRRPCSPR